MTYLKVSEALPTSMNMLKQPTIHNFWNLIEKNKTYQNSRKLPADFVLVLVSIKKVMHGVGVEDRLALKMYIFYLIKEILLKRAHQVDWKYRFKKV